MLDALIYRKTGFLKPEMTANFLAPEKAAQLLGLLVECVEGWISSVARAELPDDLEPLSLPALFDVLMSGLYAAVLFDDINAKLTRNAFIHRGREETAGFFPYIWMCPACVAENVAPREAYLPGGILKPNRNMYARKELLARPEGRMIGDFGALCIRAIIRAIVTQDAHFAAGGGHRGEFDLIISTEKLLILGEMKASPLVAFPLAARLPADFGEHHTWADVEEAADAWSLFVGAAPEGSQNLPLSPPSGSAWPLNDILNLVKNPATVKGILQAWKRHLDGYRHFNDEIPATRWHRFGCGNIETGNKTPDSPKQLRVDNTKILPGIDRTDDIKKGITQVMLFGRLKQGCRVRAVKTVLFGNLYAETHHEHYVKPLASLKLLWPGHDPVWLFDGIVALSRNILNDAALEPLFDLPNEPYPIDEMDAAELIDAAAEASDVD